MILYFNILLSVLLTFKLCSAFLSRPYENNHRLAHPFPHKDFQHCSRNHAKNDNEDEEMDMSGLSSARDGLEKLWDEGNKISPIPTSAQNAALAAGNCIVNALSMNSSLKKVLLVDVTMPSLDPAYGQSMYDDIAAVEFSVELAKTLYERKGTYGRVAIIVKDNNLIKRSKRVLQTSGDNNIYRLGSFLGDESPPIPGPDSIKQMVKLVASNAVAKDDDKAEDTIIINAPNSQVDLVGVRWLVSNYGKDKNIILFNNRLNPLPKELSTAETVYSFLPLTMKAKAPNSNKLDDVNSKVILLRRYPNDWEIHVDGSKGGEDGFRCISSIKSSEVGKRGPSMDMIALQVQKYMTK